LYENTYIETGNEQAEILIAQFDVLAHEELSENSLRDNDNDELFHAHGLDNDEDNNQDISGERRSINEVFDNLQEDVNDLRDIAMYPRYDTHGAFGEIHYNRVWLQVVFAGPDGSDDTYDDNVGNDEYLTLIATELHSERNKCIHGGQIYNPGNVNANFAKASDFLKEKMDQLPIRINDYLLSNRPGTDSSTVEECKREIDCSIDSIESLFHGWLEHEKHRDNSLLRMEFTVVVKERSNLALNRMPVAWPSNATTTQYSDIRHSIFFLPQSDIFNSLKSFYENNFIPLKMMTLLDIERLYTFSAESKTRLLWCAESIVRLTANNFFVGKIHNYLRSTSSEAGTFAVHSALKKHVPARDRNDLKISWGIDPVAQPSKFKQNFVSDNRLESEATIKRAIRTHKGNIDFPTVYVSAAASFWVTTQRYSLNKNKYFDIGLFEPPDWKELATMNRCKCEKYLQTMMKTLLNSYYDNWYYILKQYSRRWTNREHASNFQRSPTTHHDVTNHFSGTLWLTNSNSVDARRVTNTGLSQKDKTPIDNIGKFFSKYTNDTAMKNYDVIFC
jgi:hypothetical protein